MSSKTRKSDLKVVRDTAPDAAPVKKAESKGTFCKEFECKDKAQVSGYCRLHFLKLVKNNTAAGKARAEDKEEKEAKQADRWDRRKGSRGFEGGDDIGTAARADMVDQLGTLDAELTGFLDGEDLDPFKKTG